METIASFNELAGHLGALVYSAAPLAALHNAGFELDPALSTRLNGGLDGDGVGLPVRLAAAEAFGATPPVRMFVGQPTAPAAPAAPPPGASQVSGFDFTVTANVSTLETALAAWWNAKVYPQDVSPSVVSSLLDVPTLAAHCLGVPDASAITALLFPTPPTVQGAGPDRLALHQRLILRLTGVGTAATLVATATVLLPVELVVRGDRIRVDNLRIAEETTVSLAFDAGSDIQPRSAADLVSLQEDLSPRLAIGLGFLALQSWSVAATHHLFGVLANSQVSVEHAGLWLLGDRAVLGALVAPSPTEDDVRPQPPNGPLAEQADPATPPDDVRAVLGELAIEQVLRAGLVSGDIASVINTRFAAKFDPLPVPTMAVDSAHVTVQTTHTVTVELDCRMLGVCLFGSDLGFTATVALTPSIVGNRLHVASEGIDVNLENVDVLLCLLENAMLGKLGILLTAIGMIAGTAITVPFNRDVDAFLQGGLLQGTEVHPRIELHHVHTTAGQVHGSGGFTLVPDDVLTFVYVQVVTLDPATGLVTELEGVHVDLLELDPPTAGDDFDVPPDVSESFTIKHTRVTHTERYIPLGATVLAGATTERHGLARFAVLPNGYAGVVRTRDVRRNLQTQEIEEDENYEEAVGPDAPDLAVTVTLADGTQPVVRQLVALNLAGKHLGTPQEPVRVVLVAGHPHAQEASVGSGSMPTSLDDLLVGG